MANYNYEYEIEPVTRPSFLTWLCILTFIGSGWAIVSSIYTFTLADRYANIFSEEKTLKQDTVKVDSSNAVHKEGSGLSKKVERSFSKILERQNLRNLALGNLIASLMTLGGAILMWYLSRIGFYIYIAGVIMALLVPFYLFGNDLIAVGATSFSNFFGLVFIALYALNLKSMKRNSKNERV
jgi:hypothetical protein